MNKMRRLLAVFILCQSLLGPPVQAQVDGSFWWMNTGLIKKAEQYRQEKDVKANVVNNETEFDSIRLAGNTYTDESDDSPDCICVPSHLCQTTLTGKQGRDSLCGSGQTCCRKHQIISQHHSHSSSHLSSTPQKPLIPSSLHAPDTPPSSEQNLNPVLPIDLPDNPNTSNLSLLLEQHHPHASTNLTATPHRPLIPSSLHAPGTPHSADQILKPLQAIEHPGQAETPNVSLLLEISSLLQEFNSHDNSFEPDAEFIFEVTPRTPSTVSPATTSSKTMFKPIVFGETNSTPRPVISTRTTPSIVTTTTTTTTTTTQRPLLPSKPKKCGQRRTAIASRVHFFDEDESIEEVFSGMVNFGEYPWTVYLEERINNGSFLYKCGGALITSNAIVTAGHCIANARDRPENFQVIAGDWDLRHNLERLPSQRRTVGRIILHPDYYSGSLYNDIAVLIFNSPLNDSLPNVGNVCLPSPGSDFNSSSCIISSWGATPSKQNEEEPIQRFVTMPIVPGADCEEHLRMNSSLGRRFRMHDSFLCAGGIVGVDSCKGSGGSPLVCQRNGAYMLAGIMSWGVSCGKGDPVVFTNVAYQSSWVSSVIDSLDDNVVHFV